MQTLNQISPIIESQWYLSNEERFLEWISPELETILASVSHELATLPIPIESSSLLKSVFFDLKHIWLPRLERCCVLELHGLKERGFFENKDPLEAFIEVLKTPEHREFLLNKYSVLKSKLRKFQEMYLKNFSAFIKAIKADYALLKERFLDDSPDYTMVYLNFVGDPHHHYKRVMLITFADGENVRKVIYKPREIDNECVYNGFLSVLNQKLPLPLKITRCLKRDGHGYCEYIERKTCTEATDIEHYYWRYGALVAVCYFLNIADMHYENVIASGPDPVLVDLECMAAPIIASPETPDTPLLPPETVLLSGLLPHYEFTEEGCMDISALGGGIAQEVPFEMPQLEKDASGNFFVKRKRAVLIEQANRPQYQNRQLKPQQYAKQITEGFRTTYETLMQNRETFFSDVLEHFSHCHARLVLRSTHVYMTLIQEQYHPTLLFDREKSNEHLMWVEENSPDKLGTALSEFTQMQNDDVPAYYALASSEEVKDAYGQQVGVSIYQTGLERLRANFRNADQLDLEKQVSIINLSLDCLNLNDPDSTKMPLGKFHARKFPESTKASRIERAATLLDFLQEQAFSTHKQRCYWATHDSKEISDKNYYYMTTTSLDLYNGLSGILLPYVYMSAVFGYRRYEPFWHQALQGIEKSIEEQLRASSVDLGLFSGIGGIAYLSHILFEVGESGKAESLSELYLRVASEKLSSWLGEEKHSFDLIGGVSGFMIALYRLGQHLPMERERIANLLEQCRDFIFLHYENPAVLPERAKNAHIQRAMLGMSHGVSGIAWVLCLLFNDQKTKRWIDQALTYERQCYSSQNQNWPNFVNLKRHTDASNKYQTDWCHGSVGIGLNRLDMFRAGWRDARIEEEIRIALTSTLQSTERAETNLCHGSLGTHDFILYAAQSQLVDQKTYQKICNHIDSMTSDLNRCITEGSLQVCKPGLMTGYAGVAYQLLRMIEPEKVPSVLLLHQGASW